MKTHNNNRKSFISSVVSLAIGILATASANAEDAFEARCVALQKTSVAGGEITEVRFIAATRESNQAVPNHCKVQGQLNKRKGVDGKAYAIGFELRLPQEWNERFFFQCGGGPDGVLRPALGAHPGANQGGNALSRGFAVVSTDAGHLNEPGVEGSFLFGADPQARADYGYALKFDLDRDPARTTRTSGPFKQPATRMMSADSLDIDAFTTRGGKLLLYHGMADAIFSAYDTADYVEKLMARYGKRADGALRLFLIPGTGYCGGGPATDQFDPVSALVDWVEKGTAPDILVATAGANTPWHNRSRPLCPYPKRAIYNGSGSVEDTANFSCKE